VDVGFIGVGNMGGRMVELLLADGHHVTVWARRAASIEPFVGRVNVVDSPRAVGAASDVVGICVWDEHDCDNVLLGDNGVLAGIRPAGVVSLHSTIAPEACVRLEREAVTLGAGCIDAPVSVGSAMPKPLVMVGGDAASVGHARPYLDSIGDPVLHLGPTGSGQIAKLVNNTLLAAQIGLGVDALTVGAELGLDKPALVAALAAGSSRGVWSDFAARGLAPGNTRRATGSRTSEWAHKDVGLILDLAAAAGVDVNCDLMRLAARGADFCDAL
jgi:3-hydroxyisobutyrate dehydrogenase-like beta-hydroxyacid dehydrogenase